MKILHTSDWHLGKRLGDFSRLEEQKQVLKEIAQIADNEKADAIIVAGDLFDTFNPSTDAVELFYKTLKQLSNNGQRAVIAIAGNHDSPDRIEAPDPLARECGIIFAGHPHSTIAPFELDSGLKVNRSEKGFLEIFLPHQEIPLRLLLTPYANEYRLKTWLNAENSEEELRAVLQEKWQYLAEKYCDSNGVNLLATHLFVVKKGNELPEEPEEEKPILHVGGAQAIYTENIPKQIQYTALGHLHRMHAVGDTPTDGYYCGSPLAYSFAEAGQQKYILSVSVHPGEEAQVTPIQLNSGKKLLRHSADGVNNAINWLQENPDTLVELTLISDNFITATQRRALSNAHDGIVSIIPQIKNTNLTAANNPHQINLQKNMEDLFRDYFLHKNGQAPNDEIMNLFRELLALEEQ